jgi:hypothetical protein
LVGVAREDVLVSGTRTIVSSNSATSVSPSAGWNLGAGCKNSDSVVIAWENAALTPGAWVNNCTEGATFSTPKLMNTANWGTVTDSQGFAATSYGQQVTVLGVPNRSKQFAILSLMSTAAGIYNQDVVIATSIDSGQTFTARAVLNATQGVSASSWTYTNVGYSNYTGMAAVGPGGNQDGNDFWPTWVAQNGSNGPEVIVTAEWTTP